MSAVFAAMAILTVLAGLSSSASAAQAPFGAGSIPAGMLEQLRGMSPDQAQRLAAQYGVDLSSYMGQGGGASVLGPLEQSPIGRPGEGIQPAYPSSGFYEFDGQGFDQEEVDDYDGSERVESLRPSDRFGLDFFKARVSTFAPVDNAPVPADYILGAGDSLEVLLIGSESRQLTLSVDRSGEIAFPELGKIAVAGLTFDDARKLIRQRVASQLIGVEAIVGVGRLRAINVMIAGEVRVPGARSLSAFAKVSHALFSAGGLSSIGSLRRIQVKRGGDTVATFDGYDLLISGDASDDVTLRDGDVVFVPPVRAMARVSGLVRRPAVYELAENTSLADLVEMAGGLTARALVREGLLERQTSDGVPEIIPLALSGDLLASTQASAGDRLRILPSANRFGNGLTLRGAVQRPGIYGYRPGMRVSDIVRNAAADLALEVDFNYALIVSTDSISGKVDIEQFRPRDVLEASGAEGDPVLQPRDELLFFFNTAANRVHDIAKARAEVAEAGGEGAAMEAGEAMASSSEQDGRDRNARNTREPRSAAVAASAASQGGSEAAVEADGDADADADGSMNAAQRASRSAESRGGASNVDDEPVRRQVLLAPVIARLEAQASPTEPVRVVAVSGAVHASGEYPLGKGDTVADLIAAAGGLRGDAYTRELELQRVVIDAQGVGSIRTYQIGAGAGAALDLDFELASRDRLMVRAISDWRPDDIVQVSGELRFPGEYRIAPGETLGQLLRRSGGLTADGFPEGAVFTRASVAEREERETERFIRELRRNAAASTLTLEQSSVDVAGIEDLVTSLRSLPTRGRMVVDLSRLMVGDASADLVLQDGDELHIPPRTRTVTVVGEVQHPATFRFQESFDYRDYLAMSAGSTRRADEKRMYVLHANGEISRLGGRRNWLKFQLADEAIRPGDTIIVPIDTSYRDTLAYWTSVTQIVYQTGIAIAAILQLTN